MKALAILALCFSLLSGTLAQTAKVMSYNIRYDNETDEEDRWDLRKAAVADLIQRYHPMAVGIQEGLQHQLLFLDSVLVDYSYVGVGRKDGKTKGEYSAIFYDTTEIKLQSHTTFWLSDTPHQVSIGWDAVLERICTYALFSHKASGQQFWVFNTHFDHLGLVARKSSAHLIVERIEVQNRSSNYPVILMGDFNATADKEPIDVLLALMHDSYDLSETPHQGPEGTWNGFRIDGSIDHGIDYIFTEGFIVLDHVHIDDRRENGRHISDHLPVMITLQFK